MGEESLSHLSTAPLHIPLVVRQDGQARDKRCCRALQIPSIERLLDCFFPAKVIKSISLSPLKKTSYVPCVCVCVWKGYYAAPPPANIVCYILPPLFFKP